MKPTSLKLLMQEGVTSREEDGLIVQIKPSWVVGGEKRVSYTTIVRLVECCREHHWNIDIVSRDKTNVLDSITKSLECEFLRSIPVETKIYITYGIKEVRTRGYSIEFQIRDVTKELLFARIIMVSVFYSSREQGVIQPPIEVRNYLVDLAKHSLERLI